MTRMKSGSALLVVLIISSILACTITSVWRSTFFMTDIARLRQRSYQKLYSMQAFMRLAVATCIHHYTHCSSLLTDQETVVLECAAWPLSNHETCHVAIYARYVNECIHLRAQSLDKKLHAIHCTIALDEHPEDEQSRGQPHVVQWQDVWE